jgi:hypothetical protein
MPFQFRKEAIEEDLNSNFPSQGQGNPPLYYSLSEVVVPTYSINDVAEGTSLPEMLQTAWDFSTGHNTISNATTNIITNTGFWQYDLVISNTDGGAASSSVYIDTGLATKVIFKYSSPGVGNAANNVMEDRGVVFLRSGDTLVASGSSAFMNMDIWYRQIADLNGNLVNPLGFSFA